MLQEKGLTKNRLEWQITRTEDETHNVEVIIFEDGSEAFDMSIQYESVYWANMGHLRLIRALNVLDTSKGTAADHEQALQAATDRGVVEILREVDNAISGILDPKISPYVAMIEQYLNDHDTAMANIEVN